MTPFTLTEQPCAEQDGLIYVPAGVGIIGAGTAGNAFAAAL